MTLSIEQLKKLFSTKDSAKEKRRKQAKIFAKRNEKIVEMYATFNYNYVALGSIFGLTKERVRQILRLYLAEEQLNEIKAENHRLTSLKHLKSCPVCGKKKKTAHCCRECWEKSRPKLDAETIKANQKRANKDWQRRHPERYKEILNGCIKRYYVKNREKILEKNRYRWHNDIEYKNRILKSQERWHSKNREEYQKKVKERMKDPAYASKVRAKRKLKYRLKVGRRKLREIGLIK